MNVLIKRNLMRLRDNLLNLARELVWKIGNIFAFFVGKTVLNVIICRPSYYDQDGFVAADKWGVLPNLTLDVIYERVRRIMKAGKLGSKVIIRCRVYDEAVGVIKPSRIALLCQGRNSKTIVLFAGVQTSQVVRCADLVKEFQNHGIKSVVGGPHVTGIFKIFLKRIAQDISILAALGLQNLLDSRASLFVGELEGAGPDKMLILLQDFLTGKMPSIYDYSRQLPDISDELLPCHVPGMSSRYFMPTSRTVETSRGCPHNCRFCSAWIIQGRKIRPRSVSVIISRIREDWKNGKRFFFITSDNSARYPYWEQLFAEMILLQQKGMRFDFAIQADTLVHEKPGFLQLAAQAGCTQAFIGAESVNPANLDESGKIQNSVDKYRPLIESCRELGITVHFGYIIGFDHDTPESLCTDLKTLMAMGPDMVSFFIKTKIPGSLDHLDAFSAGEWLNPDFNLYNGLPISRHPQMSDAVLVEACRNAWETFYSLPNLVRIMKRTKKEYYWRVLANLVWVLYSLRVSQRHPLASGFTPVYDRLSRREGFPRMSLLQFWGFKWRKRTGRWRNTITLAYDIVEVWLQTRERSEREKKLASRLAEIHPGEWITLRITDFRQAYRSLGMKPPNVLKIWLQRFAACNTRCDIRNYWSRTIKQLKRGRIHLLFNYRSARILLADTFCLSNFLKSLIRSL